MSQFLAMEKRVAVIQAVMDGALRLLGIDEPAPAREPAAAPLTAPASAAAAAITPEPPARPRPRSRSRDERYPRGGGEPVNQSSATAP
jgi:hypothetical protein